MCHRKGRNAELRIKRRGRERQNYAHGRLEKGSEREGEDGGKKQQKEV